MVSFYSATDICTCNLYMCFSYTFFCVISRKYDDDDDDDVNKDTSRKARTNDLTLNVKTRTRTKP